MQNIMITIAGLLLAAARVRAESMMQRCADVRINRNEAYSSNAGGWN